MQVGETTHEHGLLWVQAGVPEEAVWLVVRELAARTLCSLLFWGGPSMMGGLHLTQGLVSQALNHPYLPGLS